MNPRKAIELMEDIEDKLKAILSHRDCTQSLWSYIKASILNKEFYQALVDERSLEAFKNTHSELWLMFNDGNFGEVEGKTLYHDIEVSDNKEGINLTVYHRDTETPINSGVIHYEGFSTWIEDLNKIQQDFKVKIQEDLPF